MPDGYANIFPAAKAAIGMWLSLVERCVRDAEAAGSNPVIPTIAWSRLGVRTEPFSCKCAYSLEHRLGRVCFSSKVRRYAAVMVKFAALHITARCPGWDEYLEDT